MFEMSNKYKSQIRKTVRNYSYMRIQFRLTDPDADVDAEVSNSGQTAWSENPNVLDTKQVSPRYATLEQNRWLLNGTMQQLPEGEPYEYQGFVGSQLSDKDGNMAEPTVITVQFDNGPYSFRGLTLQFDTVCIDYPAEIQILASLEDTIVYDRIFEVDAVEFAVSEPIPGNGSFADKLEITFLKTSLPHRRIRIEGLVLGLCKTFDEASLVSSEWKRANDLMNTVLPDESMKYTFYDPKREYNPDNPEGIWAFVESGQQVKFQYGYQLDDGSVEWMPGSTYYVDGSPTAESSSVLSKATFNTVSKLQSLTDIYDEGVYDPNGRTLYELAESLMQWAGVKDGNGHSLYILADSLKNYTVTAPLPVQQVRELLQLIANAGMCILHTDRDGKIVFAPRSNKESAFQYTGNDVKSKAPTVKKYPYLKNLTVMASSYAPASNEEELTSINVSNAAETEYLVEFDAATDVNVTAMDGLSVDSVIGVYARRARVVVTGTGKLIITGKKLNESSYVVQKSCSPVGEDCTLENQLICSQAHALEYLQWMADILTKRNVYTFEDRGFPEVDAADPVTLDTAFSEERTAQITSITVKYNGALSGNIVVLS